ncbi:MAG: hypothetical protein KAG94_04530 [Clostridiales bacterium]|nr:hypothetical protein [Clostridiales bacterium]
MKWILLQYELPNEPSKYRVGIWRRLKKQNAYKLLDGLYCLPYTDSSLERFNWISADIEKMGGKAMLWASDALLQGQEAEIIKKKTKAIKMQYEKLYEKINEISKDEITMSMFKEFSRQWADIKWHDPVGDPLGESIKDLLTKIRIMIRRNEK